MSDDDAMKGLRVWQEIAGGMPETTPEATSETAVVTALADRVTTATVDALLAASGLPQPAVMQSRLLNRFRHQAGRKWLQAIRDAGVPCMAIKGLASGAWLYDRPEDRGISDADLLIRPDDLARVLDVLQAAGFAFADEPTRSRWGFISQASFQPLLSPDGAVNIDLHIAGDAAPFAEALPTETLFAAGRAADGVCIPAREHAFLIAASHAARDLFTGDAAKTVIDGLLMLKHHPGLDWAEIARCSRSGRMLKPVSVFTALLQRLGADTSAAEDHLPLHRVRGSLFEQVVRDHLLMFPPADSPDAMARFCRQWRLAAAPTVALQRDLRRLTGLVRPHGGIPGQRTAPDRQARD
ncbi:MAG: nucleotidyltransferase family protein [Minwuia sp.]|nr:nucleotidyltransferase family protein [Minwuia sp.]